MKSNKIYYHGTTKSNLTKFKIGINESGECITPIDGIWLSKSLDGARWHAARTKNINKKNKGYVYEVKIKSCAVFVDATQPSLPDTQFKYYKSQQNILRRLFIKNINWYTMIESEVLSRNKNNKLSDEQVRNYIIKECKNIEVDCIINPLVATNTYGEIININEPIYKETLLLINLDKVDSIKILDTV